MPYGRKDVSEQNKLLHQHLGSVSSEAACIGPAAGSSAAAQTEGDATADLDTKLVEICQVVQYLRKEKEIFDLLLALCKQENARLKSQNDVVRGIDSTFVILLPICSSGTRNASALSGLQHLFTTSGAPSLNESINSTILWESNACDG